VSSHLVHQAVGAANRAAAPGWRPLDILIVTSEAPPIVSGISTCIDRLAAGLIAREHRVSVLSSIQIPRVAVGEWRLSSFVAHWPRIARRLRHFDVVNLHGPVPTMSDAFLWLSGWLPQHLRPAIVYTHHSPIDIKGASGMSAYYNRMHKLLALRADRIVASSQHYARQHHSRYGPATVSIPWGTDPRSPQNPQAARLPRRRRPGDELHVLFVGQMRPYKGVETLLAAAAGQPWMKLTLVGEGAELARYRRLAERWSVANARFTGRLSPAELHRQYETSDAVVLPSVTRAEAFGLVLLEGMAAGCVPVASDLPGVRDVAAPTGLVVPAGNPAALRAALRGLACDAALLERLAAASRRAAQALTWDRCVTAYERVMLEAVRGRYARLHGVAMLPELDGPADPHDRLRVLATPDAGPRDGTLPGRYPVPLLGVAGEPTEPVPQPVPAGEPPEPVSGVPAGANQRHR
jgi:glycosyltransferase involved in cell wall biosynthesis